MNIKLTTIVFCLCTGLLFGDLFAQNEGSSILSEEASRRSTFKHAINVCPIAPVFGIYALNYEFLMSPKNGIVARIEYESIPKTYTDASIESSGMAYSLNYRRHFAAEMNSLFIGAYARYRIYKGHGKLEATAFDFTLPSLTFGLNAGKRWVWNSGFDITVSAGYGYSKDYRKASPSSAIIEDSLDQLEMEYDFISPFLGEVSVGYSF